MMEMMMKQKITSLAVVLLFCFCGTAHAVAPQRIVSLKPNVTDIIYALGAGDRLVGITKYCDVPDGAVRPEVVADYTQPYIERIIAMRPDIVIGSMENSSRRSVESLRRLGIEVKLFSFTTFAETISSIGAIGESVGMRNEADTIIKKMKQKLGAVRKRWQGFPQSRVVIVWGIKPLVVAGRGTFMDELLESIAVRNAVETAKIKYPHIGIEELIAIDPDVIVDLSMGSEAEKSDEATRPWDGIKSLKAVREGRIIRLDASMFRAGPALPDAIGRMGEIIHDR